MIVFMPSLLLVIFTASIALATLILLRRLMGL